MTLQVIPYKNPTQSHFTESGNEWPRKREKMLPYYGEMHTENCRDQCTQGWQRPTSAPPPRVSATGRQAFCALLGRPVGKNVSELQKYVTFDTAIDFKKFVTKILGIHKK